MRKGLILSLLMHGTLLAWAVFVFHKTNEFRTEPEAIAVAMITPSELLRLKQGSELSKQLVSKATQNPQQDTSNKESDKPKPKRAPSLPSTEEPSQNVTKPKAASSSEISKPSQSDPVGQKISETAQSIVEQTKKKEEEKKKTELETKKIEEAKRKAKDAKVKEENKKREAKRKDEEAKKKAEVSDRLAALLDKDPSKKGSPLAGTDPLVDQKGPTAGSQKGSDTVLSLREEDLLRGLLRTQIAKCWRLPGGGGGTETPIVTLHWRMRPDGTLEGDPQVERPASGPLASLATEAAIRAVTGCQPFDLPQNLYENGWKEIIWEFDPTQML